MVAKVVEKTSRSDDLRDRSTGRARFLEIESEEPSVGEGPSDLVPLPALLRLPIFSSDQSHFAHHAHAHGRVESPASAPSPPP